MSLFDYPNEYWSTNGITHFKTGVINYLWMKYNSVCIKYNVYNICNIIGMTKMKMLNNILTVIFLE